MILLSWYRKIKSSQISQSDKSFKAKGSHWSHDHVTGCKSKKKKKANEQDAIGLVLHLIDWESGSSFLNRSERGVKQNHGNPKSRQSQITFDVLFQKLYKGKHVSSKKKRPLFQAITFLFLIMSFCLFVFRCLNSRLYFQSGSCCFFILPDHCTSLFQIQLRWIVYRDDHEDNKNSFQSESS